MNPPRYHNDLELIAQLAHNATHLDALPHEDLTALADVFRLPLTAKEEGGRAVRRVLHEALVLEREHFSAYLQLPKFKPLPPRTLALVHCYCNYLWTAFVAQRQYQGPSHPPAIQTDRSTGMTAQGGNEGKVNPFEYYRAYQYPKFGMDQPKVAYTPFPYYYNFQHYSYSQYPPQQQPPILKPTNHFYKDTNAEGEREHAMRQERQERVDRVDRSEKGEKVQKIQKPDKKQKVEKREKVEKGDKSDRGEPSALKGIDQNSESKAKSSSKKQHELAKKQSQASKKQIQQAKQPQITPSRIINLRFLQCACLGHPITTSQKSFECHQCKNLFHYSCLHLSASDGKSCPFCTLTRHHAFTEAMPRTIKSGWFEIDHKECFLTKLHLDADEFGTFKRYMSMLEKDKEGIHAIQFRILRINEKAKVRAGRKIIKTSFPLLPNELRKIESRHWIELKLKQITQPSLIFYLMTMIKIKDRSRIQQDYKSLEQSKVRLAELWAEQERTSGKKIQLSMMHPISKKIIELPVRGEHCEHLQCEDMLQLYEQFLRSAQDGNNLLFCSYCKKNYTAHSKFTADTSLFSILQNRPEKAKKLKLENGKAEWFISDSVSEVQMQEESNSISES